MIYETTGSTQAEPLVYVVMPTYNRWDEARVSIACLLKSDYRNFHILLVEDACTDGTVERCRAEFPEVEILHGDGDLWWSGATNLGTRHALAAGADLILWINDDIRAEPQTLSSLVESQHRNGEKSVVCARVRLPDGVREWRGDPPPWHPEHRTWRQPELPTVGDLAMKHPAGGQGVLIPARCFHEIGFLDRENFAMNWADHNFHYRAMRAGYHYFIATRAVVSERPNKQPPQERDLHTLRNVWWFLTNRRSYGNMRALRRHLKLCLSPREYRRVFYPILARHILWLSYGWLTHKPLLHKPLSAAKRNLSTKRSTDAATR
ncbi:MAG: hypothetical protein QOE33_2463 [Acidobacteriota bacterium]|nr:hypothetical protein [Acidobacteriota bacterium]